MRLISDTLVAQISLFLEGFYVLLYVNKHFGSYCILNSLVGSVYNWYKITAYRSKTTIFVPNIKVLSPWCEDSWHLILHFSPSWRTVQLCSSLMTCLLVFVRNNTNEFLIKNLSLRLSILGNLYLKRNIDFISVAQGKYTRVIEHGSS